MMNRTVMIAKSATKKSNLPITRSTDRLFIPAEGRSVFEGILMPGLRSHSGLWNN